MAETIQIPLDEMTTLAALHNVPAGQLSVDIQETLVIMVHGFPGSKTAHNDLFGDLESILATEGHHTLRFDFRGCGQSPGEPEIFSFASAKKDLRAVLGWATEQDYQKFIFICEGLGASVACLNNPANLSAMVLLWPILDVKSMSKDYLKPLNNNLDLKKELKETDFIASYLKVKAPTMVMQGSNDDVVPSKQLNMIRDYFRSTRLEITTFHGGEHGLPELKHRKMMFHHITKFINNYS